MISRALQDNSALVISTLCVVAGVSCSGYYSYRKRPAKNFGKVDILIKEIFYSKHSTVGYRTIKMILEQKHHHIVNHKRILRSMRMQQLKTKIRVKRYPRVPTITSAMAKAFPDLVERKFSPQQVNKVYSGDVTEFRIASGQRIYMYAAKDLGSKEIVTFNISTTPNAALVTTTLAEHLNSLKEDVRKNLIYHTDQGTVFMCDSHINMMQHYKVKQSMSRRGNCLDNSPIESFFGHFKDEVMLKDCKTITEVKKNIETYIFYYNNERPQWGLKRKTPAEYRSLLI